jgi:CRISPR-associated endonuclease/helicase Cas3
MPTQFFAHSTKAEDKHNWQGLAAHSHGVAELAAAFGETFGIGRSARLAGLLHDLGKYNPAFQAYIEHGGGSVDHSTAGAWWTRELAKSAAPRDRVVAELIAHAIAGHHAGLPDRIGSAASLDERLHAYEDQLSPVWRSEIEPQLADLMPPLPWVRVDKSDPLTKQKAAFQLAMLGRMIFSCLVDADYRETESFYAAVEGREVDRDWPSLPSLLDRLIGRFNDHMAQFPVDGSVNRLRADILTHVRSKAILPPGFFTLTVPTGGGKTLASLGFALDHARHHGLRRIVFSIPFTSIIDQSAAIFRGVLGEGVVLEHHSAIEDERISAAASDADSRGERPRLRRAMEDWEPPVIVTTNVQLLESLFASRTSRARKLRGLPGSVLVLDEAQTLPVALLGPTIWALESLVRDWGCSIVLCTATQPALDKRKIKSRAIAGLIGIDVDDKRELAPDPPSLARQLRRTTLRRAGAMTNDGLVEALNDVPQALVIVNSRRHALELYRAAEVAKLDGAIHLSTRQYAVHRRRILDDVRDRLKGQKPCRLIATSLVEAGVDLDFPCAWRAEVGLEQLIQTAGRVNREGARATGESIVTLFEAPDYPPPLEIAEFVAAMRRMEGEFSDDLFSPGAITRYFEEVYWQRGTERLDRGVSDKEPILAKFNLDVNRGETAFGYRSAAENFRLIESGMVPVIVAQEEAAKRAVENLAVEAIPTGRLARELQLYTVAVPPRARALLIDRGRVKFMAPKTRGDAFAVLVDRELYRPDVGLLWEDPDYLALDNLMF